jgi:hypothetical protein
MADEIKRDYTPSWALPVLITEPGTYVTRCGEQVVIEDVATSRHSLCWGRYASGVREHWHPTGRIFNSSLLSDNDIVSKAP